MRLPVDPNLPIPPADAGEFARRLNFQLIQWMRSAAQQLNQLSEGAISAVTNAATTAPTTGAWQQGDQIRNSAPAEAGGAGSKYVIVGWICTAAGTPGTWKEMRCLTEG